MLNSSQIQQIIRNNPPYPKRLVDPPVADLVTLFTRTYSKGIFFADDPLVSGILKGQYGGWRTFLLDYFRIQGAAPEEVKEKNYFQAFLIACENTLKMLDQITKEGLLEFVRKVPITLVWGGEKKKVNNEMEEVLLRCIKEV